LEQVKDFVRPLDEGSYVKDEETVRQALWCMDKARQEGKPLCLLKRRW
jgi:hypothetical protein